MTEAGGRFVEAVTKPLAAIHTAVKHAQADVDHARGTLRLNMSVSAARQLASFFTAYTRTLSANVAGHCD